ncbi:MAG: MerR family transcriptional regulator [Spirochaetes bacterium]|uniref:MerR family transcriptional regulator n=1 Tax=Candidatus Gallitreponema excrementavium TaxID=2840840 RepID=A0A9D9HN57_9SPIR|nr:MerR family transcriptional regulator [Candidatus Gallitreponema excrementavium]
MAEFFIGEVEKITGVKAHVLRYWEEQVPFLSPKKDFAGRRVYSAADIQLIQRLNYLIEKRKFTLQGAFNEIIRENLSGNNTEIKSVIGQVKGELITLYKIVSKYTDKNDDPETPENGMIK